MLNSCASALLSVLMVVLFMLPGCIVSVELDVRFRILLGVGVFGSSFGNVQIILTMYPISVSSEM